MYIQLHCKWYNTRRACAVPNYRSQVLCWVQQLGGRRHWLYTSGLHSGPLTLTSHFRWQPVHGTIPVWAGRINHIWNKVLFTLSGLVLIDWPLFVDDSYTRSLAHSQQRIPQSGCTVSVSNAHNITIIHQEILPSDISQFIKILPTNVPDKDGCRLGCWPTQSSWSLPTLRRCLLPPSSGRNNWNGCIFILVAARAWNLTCVFR
jgi:hypothetical protein